MHMEFTLRMPDEYRVMGGWRTRQLKTVAGKISVANFGIRERVRTLSRAKLVAVESALILKWAVESKFLALFVDKIHYEKSFSLRSILHLYISFVTHDNP